MTLQTANDKRFNFDMADRLRRALRVSEVSVQDMADELEISRNTVSSWINGRNTPRRRDLRQFAMRTGFPIAWLENGTEGPDGGGASSLYTPPDLNREPTDYRSGLHLVAA